MRKIIVLQLFIVLSLFFLVNQDISSAIETNTDCQIHPLYCKILELQPKVDHKWAMEFSDLLMKYGKQYHMDPWRSLAIAMQETSLKNKHRKHAVVIFGQTCHKVKIKLKRQTEQKTIRYQYKQVCGPSYRIIRGFSDLTIFQFHMQTVIAHHLDPLKLHTDLDYVVKSHYELLKIKMKRCAVLGNLAWSCYHSTTPHLRKMYAKLVDRYYFPHPDITGAKT